MHDNHRSHLFSVNETAAAFGMSVSKLSGFFKAATGQTISQYVSPMRMSMAVELLLKSDRSVKDIVRDIGYSDTSSFVRKFRLEFGVTPLKYRSVNLPQQDHPKHVLSDSRARF